MRLLRQLIPLLAVMLLIQDLVAVVPHQHLSVTTGGQALRMLTSIDGAHDCLACSVHAPVVEPAAELGSETSRAATVAIAAEHGSRVVLSILASAGPRGPPWIV